MEIERAVPKANEVEIEILFCGICHSDVHQVKNDWKNTMYPCVPGHEIVGRVRNAGSSVSTYKVGDIVGVGCMVDSCHQCESCKAGLEQYCIPGFLATYNGNQRTPAPENKTYGGYSESIVVREDFVLKIPEGMSPSAAAPLLCAGITTYSPLRHWKAGPGTKVGVVGLGGLGHMAVKIAVAMGCEVTVITTHERKLSEAMRLGADRTIVSTDADAMKAGAGSLDLILSTIPDPHDPNPYIELLARDGVYTVVGCLLPLSKPLEQMKMNVDRKSVGSTLIGGIAETQELLDFCAKHGITSDVEVIDVDSINDAYDAVNQGVPTFRYVIDMATLKGKSEDKSLAAKVGL